MKICKITLITAVSLLPLFAVADDAADVQATYSQFDDAMLAKNSETAWALMSAPSQELMENIRTLAISADKATLMQESFPIIISVFGVRKAANGIAPGSGPETLLLMSSDYDKTSKMSSMGEVMVDGDSATGPILMNGRPTEMDFAFVEEDGTWKIDMVGQMEAVEEMMMGPMEAAGMSRDMILNQMAQASGQGSVDVWQPIE